MQLINKIKQEMKIQQVKGKTLAKALNISHSYFSDIYNNRYRTFYQEEIKKICKILNIPITELDLQSYKLCPNSKYKRELINNLEIDLQYMEHMLKDKLSNDAINRIKKYIKYEFTIRGDSNEN